MRHNSTHELYHEIFGSVLDRVEMTPYLLAGSREYERALAKAAQMMGNRGFDIPDSSELPESEKKRAQAYGKQVYKYFFHSMFPFMQRHLTALKSLQSSNHGLYSKCLREIADIEETLSGNRFRAMSDEDPRHLFLLAASRKYPGVFNGYKGSDMDIPIDWQQTACSVLKMAHIIKSIEEDSQDINDYAQLGIFLEAQGQSLDDLNNYDWQNPGHLPVSEPAQRAFVKISTFFHKLRESIEKDSTTGCLVFNSGDGVHVHIVDIRARLKSPGSMFTKLGKNVEGDVHDIRDILAITFILKNRNDTLKLFHALQKRGVILQENTLSSSITQTLFDDFESMAEAVKSLMISLSKSEGNYSAPEDKDVLRCAKDFYKAISINTAKNPYSSVGHKKFQCKINFYVPVHRTASTNSILIPGTTAYAQRERIQKTTEQHTLALELRISDEESWRTSEQKGDSHHDAYKFRQLASFMNRIFKNRFYLPEESMSQVRRDQDKIFR